MINELATFVGIAGSYTDYFGKDRQVSVETKRAILRALGYDVSTNADAAAILQDLRSQRSLQAEPVRAVRAGEPISIYGFTGILDAGYHRIGDTTVIASPRHAYVPPAFESASQWGFALQLYSLQSRCNWGIGDFGDLARFAELAAQLGAGAVALNPLHQLRLDCPDDPSPYSPLSRLYLNALYIDVAAAAAYLGATVESPPALESLRLSRLVDYPGVAREKITALQALYYAFTAANNEPRKRFAAFRRERGGALRSVATYETLCAQFGGSWLDWPEPYRTPASRTVAQFAAENENSIAFHEFLQWLADMQLERASAAASGMAAGLYRDLALGVSAGSFDVWSDPDAYCLGISAGAPPDALNEQGQNWGLTPWNPRVLRERAYSPWRDALRANMRHAGALRIDHVMGLMRLFVVPDGAPTEEGAYLSFRFEEMASVLRLESVLHRCLVVGEDLGTLPSGFRERMAQSRFFSCRLLYFENPAAYPHDAVASTGTHDLPPLAGYREHLDVPDTVSDLDLAFSSYRALGESAAALVLVQMEDALLQRESVNVPGTSTEQPNWRRKLRVPLEALQDDPSFGSIVETVQRARAGGARVR